MVRWANNPRDVARKRAINKAAIARTRAAIIAEIGPTVNWPRGVIRAWVKLNPDNRDRFTLTCFIMANGVNPVLWKKYVNMAYMLGDRERGHIDWIIQNYRRRG